VFFAVPHFSFFSFFFFLFLILLFFSFSLFFFFFFVDYESSRSTPPLYRFEFFSFSHLQSLFSRPPRLIFFGPRIVRRPSSPARGPFLGHRNLFPRYQPMLLKASRTTSPLLVFWSRLPPEWLPFVFTLGYLPLSFFPFMLLCSRLTPLTCLG